MVQESPRIAQLRRRVQADPASIAFAQLAEEYRRAGNYQEAVKYCRTGLARHSGYLSARVTLGRSLLELGELDDATREFELVLRSAPENLAAVRAMAEIYRRRGDLSSALEYYKRALTLARFDPELEDTVARISQELPAPVADAVAAHASDTASAENSRKALMDFDALLAALGAPHAAAPPVVERLLNGAHDVLVDASSLPPAGPDSSGPDPFAEMEHALRSAGNTSTLTATAARRLDSPAVAFQIATEPSTEMFVQELESWLSVLVAERPAPSGA